MIAIIMIIIIDTLITITTITTIIFRQFNLPRLKRESQAGDFAGAAAKCRKGYGLRFLLYLLVVSRE